jgi:RNA recognition motif-containing protein
LNGRQVLLKFAADREDTTGSSSNEAYPSAQVAPLSPGSSVQRPSSLNRQSSSLAAPRKLFVYNLSPNTSSESLGAVFGEYGPMEECFVVSDQNGTSKRYAFVTFYTEDSTWRCLEEPSKLVDGQMTFTHLASEGPSSSSNKNRNIRRPSPPQIDNLTPLAELLNGLMLSAACK